MNGIARLRDWLRARLRLVDDWRQAWRWRSVRVASMGAIMGALGAGLAASTSAAALAKVFPAWAVWAGGALICALTVAGRLTKEAEDAPKRPRKVGHINWDRDT